MQFDFKYIKKFIYFAIPALTLTSCVSEDFDAMETKRADGVPMYITFEITTSDGTGTKAIPDDSWYQDGDEGTEHPEGGDKGIVQGAHAIFFDAAGNFMAMADMNPMSYENGGNHQDTGATGTVEARYWTVLSASREESEQPKQVIVVLNDSPVLDQLTAKAVNGSRIKDFTDIIWTDLQGNGRRLSQTFAGMASPEEGKAFMTLSNAAYLDGSTVHYAYEIPKGSFKETENEAKSSQGVIVHVERMVSKFTPLFLGYTPDKLTYRPYDGNQLTIIHFDDNGEPTYEAQNWNMTVIGWGMNGLETQNYLFKQISNKGYYGWSATGTYGWNDASNWRSYWAEDPHYGSNQGLYPFQYRRAVEKNHDEDFKYYGDQATHGIFEDRSASDTYHWALKYFSYNELKTNSPSSENYCEHLYAPENTYEEAIATTDELDNRNNKIAGTHMLICAQLKVTDDGLSNFQPVGEHFYRDRIGICYTSDVDLFWGFCRAVNRKLESQGYMQYTYYTWDENETPIKPESRYFGGSGKMKLYYGDQPVTYALVKQLKDENASLWVPAPILHGDGQVFPWVVPASASTEGWLDVNKLNIRDEEGNELINGKPVAVNYYRGDYNDNTKTYEYEEVPGGFTVDDLASLFYEWCGAVDHYNEGRMYYAAPILHRASSETGSQDIYGVVRNHWYQLKINTVLNLGTPVDDPDQRIIPDNVYTKDNLKIDVELLPWHLIDIFVDLPGYEKTNNLDDPNV